MIYIKKYFILLFLTLSFPLFSQIEFEIDGGKIVIDKYDNGVFIPSNSNDLIVTLKVKQKGDSIKLNSYYSEDSLNHVEFYFFGKSNPDSITIKFISIGSCPIGFLRLEGFDKQFNLKYSYSLFSDIIKIPTDQLKYFQIIAFNAKSKLFSIDDFFIKGNMIFLYDYIAPRNIKNYKFFDMMIKK
ncbi:MAG: hypothetical protein M9897_06820 [Brumimicrobium sp.]|nr:hypothetical protein [Brumimicrobium sp.]